MAFQLVSLSSPNDPANHIGAHVFGASVEAPPTQVSQDLKEKAVLNDLAKVHCDQVNSLLLSRMSGWCEEQPSAMVVIVDLCGGTEKRVILLAPSPSDIENTQSIRRPTIPSPYHVRSTPCLGERRHDPTARDRILHRICRLFASH